MYLGRPLQGELFYNIKKKNELAYTSEGKEEKNIKMFFIVWIKRILYFRCKEKTVSYIKQVKKGLKL